MNKAFTANINDQVTARGYLDENDQLIMLEPEGSGGGGGGTYTTVYENATASFTWSADDEQATLITGITITANKIYKITIDEDVFYRVTYTVNDNVYDLDVPADSDAIGGNYLILNSDGSLSVYGDTAETWAGTAHSVKIEEMGY